MKPEVGKQYFSITLNTKCQVLELNEKDEMAQILFHDYSPWRRQEFGDGTGWKTFASFKELKEL